MSMLCQHRDDILRAGVSLYLREMFTREGRALEQFRKVFDSWFLVNVPIVLHFRFAVGSAFGIVSKTVSE